jgi:hypothetical protein
MVELIGTSKVTAFIARSSAKAYPPEPPHAAVTDRTASVRIIAVRVHTMAASLNGWTKANARIHFIRALSKPPD